MVINIKLWFTCIINNSTSPAAVVIGVVRYLCSIIGAIF